MDPRIATPIGTLDLDFAAVGNAELVRRAAVKHLDQQLVGQPRRPSRGKALGHLAAIGRAFRRAPQFDELLLALKPLPGWG